MAAQSIKQYAGAFCPVSKTRIIITVGEPFQGEVVTRIAFDDDAWIMIQAGTAGERKEIALIIPRPGDMFYY
jgi:hypothetical protein